MPAPYIKGEATKGSTSARKDGRNIVIVDTFHYVVIADKDATRDEVRNTTGLPLINFTTLANGAICTAKDAEREERQPRVWRVTCTFETIPPDQEQNEDSTPDPTTWIPKWGGSFQSFDDFSAGHRDVNGNAILNSLGKRFSEGIGLKRSLVAMPFSQYEPSSTTIFDLCGRNEKINDATVKSVFPEKTLLCQIKGFEYGWFYGYECVRVDYLVTYNPLTWIEKRMDVGFLYLNDADEEVPEYTGGILTEVKLDGSGHKLPDGDPEVWIDVERYEEISFSFLR